MEDVCKEFSNQFKENFTVFHHELSNLSKDNQTPSYKNYKERHFLFWSCYVHFPSVLCSPATPQFFHSFIFHGTPSENQILGRKPSFWPRGTCNQAWAHPMLILVPLDSPLLEHTLSKASPHDTVLIHENICLYTCVLSLTLCLDSKKNLKISKCICLYLIKFSYLLFRNDLDKNNQKELTIQPEMTIFL